MRRPPAARPLGRRLHAGAAAAILSVASACAAVPPSTPPLATGSPTPTASSAPASTPSAAPSSTAGLLVPGLPRLLWASERDGLVASPPGRPGARRPISLPPGSWRLAAATGPRGLLLLASGQRAPSPIILVARLEGDRLVPVWSRPVPRPFADPAAGLLPGCLGAADPVAAFAAATLALVLVPRAGAPRVAVAGGTIGRCQADGPDRLLFLAEAIHAVAAWNVRSGAVAVSTTRCDAFSVGGGLLACSEPGGTAWSVGALRRFGDGEPAVGRISATRLEARGVAQLDLAPGGEWLALRVADAPSVALWRVSDLAGAPSARVELPVGWAFLGFVEG